MTLLSGGIVGCAGRPLTPIVAAAIDVLECQLDAVEELVPQAELAESIVMAARAGDVDAAVAGLVQLGMSAEEVKAVAAAFSACVPVNKP